LGKAAKCKHSMEARMSFDGPTGVAAKAKLDDLDSQIDTQIKALQAGQKTKPLSIAFAKRAMLQTVFPDVFGLPADLVYGLLERIDLLLQRGKEAAKAGAGGGLRTGPILEDLRKARAAKTLLEALLKAANKAKLGGSFRWQQTGFTSLHGTGSFSLASGTLSDVDAVRVVVP